MNTNFTFLSIEVINHCLSESFLSWRNINKKLTLLQDLPLFKMQPNHFVYKHNYEM